jgi:hypothetical protein
MKEADVAVFALVMPMTAFIVLKLVGAMTGFDVFDRALEAMRPGENELLKANRTG